MGHGVRKDHENNQFKCQPVCRRRFLCCVIVTAAVCRNDRAKPAAVVAENKDGKKKKKKNVKLEFTIYVNHLGGLLSHVTACNNAKYDGPQPRVLRNNGYT